MKKSEVVTKNVVEGKPKDTKTVITKVPKVGLFTLKESDNTKYEELLQKLAKGDYEHIHTSGNWHEGKYNIQVHYYEVTKEEKPREDTDTETNIDAEIAEKDDNKTKDSDSSKSDDKTKDDKKSEETIEIRNDSVKFDGNVSSLNEEEDDDDENLETSKKSKGTKKEKK